MELFLWGYILGESHRVSREVKDMELVMKSKGWYDARIGERANPH